VAARHEQAERRRKCRFPSIPGYAGRCISRRRPSTAENNFGRLLRFKNTAGRWRSWAMPMELLKGDGSDLRGELLAMGLELDPAARQTLARYLQERTPKKRIRCALQVGWCGIPCSCCRMR
jgi:hypothetical protein